MEKYIWEPGNSTRYTLYLVPIGNGVSILALEYWQTWMFVGEHFGDHPSYIEEKLKVGKADAEAISLFIKKNVQ